ncbi:hypothetical protein BpHYR1_004020 [Brachionus plicatilis]|uniref:Uncharacterized protein n=1 Tax=Brachionus plicatilis TaxID=10195 RepID=A0A3M7T0U0_BRAPC|nr:hypothetical protein BpHYR1_004020 [Brachionus plicatilis]
MKKQNLKLFFIFCEINGLPLLHLLELHYYFSDSDKLFTDGEPDFVKLLLLIFSCELDVVCLDLFDVDWLIEGKEIGITAISA